MMQIILDTLDMPWRGGATKRKQAVNAARVRRKAIAYIRRSRRNLINYDRRQYYMADAIGDLKTAARGNEDAVILAAGSVLLIAYAVLHTAATYLYAVLQAAYELATMTGINMLVLMLIVCAILLTLSGWVLAFLMNIFSLAVQEGAVRKQNHSIRGVVRNGLRRSGRVATAWLVLILCVSVPLSGFLFMMLLLLARGAGPTQAAAYLPYGFVITVAWTSFILSQYALVPKVALFEPRLGLRAVFGRSRQLLRRKGRFLTGATGLFLVSSGLLVWRLVPAAEEAVAGLGGLIAFVSATFALLGWNGVMTMAYCKSWRSRKA